MLSGGLVRLGQQVAERSEPMEGGFRLKALD